MKKIYIRIAVLFFLFNTSANASVYKIENVSKAIEDMSKNASYPKEYAKKLAKFKAEYPSKKGSKDFQDAFDEFAREALLKNPLLEANKNWIFIKRPTTAEFKGLPQNWQSNASLNNRCHDNGKTYPNSAQSFNDEIYAMDITNPSKASPFYKPSETNGITDIDVNWQGDKIIYSAINKYNHWQIYELDLKTKESRLLSLEKYDDVDNYDGVYLPDGNIIYLSTACYASVPCVGGSDYVGNLYKLNPNLNSQDEIEKSIRQLSFDQESSWYPTVMNDGKVMYTRWEYTDNSHYFSRILMKMNPDGTGQSAHYGSASYWPTSLFYCRPIAEDSNKFVGIVTGHHGNRRSGELHLFDISKGITEEEGRIHQYMSDGKPYQARVLDGLVQGATYFFIHPYPLSEKYIVVSMKHRKESNYALYLVDIYDNLTPLYSAEDADIFEPMPLSPRKIPPIIADKVDEDVDFGYVFLNDIYEGVGLKGVARGVVKKLRIFEYSYNYRYRGSHDMVGFESGWEVKRLHGYVDVEEDGSASFKVPANRPFSIQPLDSEGKALNLFRSWFTVRPNEIQSCVGCHETQSTAPVQQAAIAAKKAPQTIKEFLAPPRGFSFDREIQPILDAYCVECHNGENVEIPNFKKENFPLKGRRFSNSYLALHPYVRRNGPESNQNVLGALEFHADTSELVQILSKGHKGVNLDESSKLSLYTWIDFNVPYHGTLSETYTGFPMKILTEKEKNDLIRKTTLAETKEDLKFRVPSFEEQEARRAFFLKKFANRVDKFERNDPKIKPTNQIQFNPREEEKTHSKNATPSVNGFPFEANKVDAMLAKAKLAKELSLNIDGYRLDFALIPAGKFIQGTNNSFYDEGPAKISEVKKPFYMSKIEISNELYSLFDKTHNSGFLDRHGKDHTNSGWALNNKNQPVLRISNEEAKEFCKWLGEKLGLDVSLPTETQWEWAARAGSDKDFWFGNYDDDFSPYENFSDAQTLKFARIPRNATEITTKLYAFTPADMSRDDKNLVSAKGGTYTANAFGLYDMGGNVAEWVEGNYTKSLDGEVVENKVVARGGSWADRPKLARTTFRRAYYPWQKVYNVGFRVIITPKK